MDYYKNKKVISWNKSKDGTYDGMVSGSEGNAYTVHNDKVYPRRSACNCPFADGRRVVCKHMIALYFTAEPKDFLKEVENWEKEEQTREQQHYEDLILIEQF